MSGPFTTHSHPSSDASSGRLKDLEQAVLRDLDRIDYPKREWVQPRTTSSGQPVLDVLIIGGGQSGLSLAFGLIREKVRNIRVIDQNPERYEGPWLTFARMITLRTPKYVTGPDQGIPNLTVRAWYEAQFGEDAWETLSLIPKELWADYLHWYRTLLNIPVQNDTAAGALTWSETDGCYHVPVTKDGQTQTLFARKVVLATGIEGSGQWEIPAMVKDNLPRMLYSHTRDDIDFGALKDKRVGVLGAGASAFDNASVALEQGAGEVHIFFRRKQLPNVNAYRWAEFVGFLKHHTDLPDADRWRFILQILRMGQLPPADTFARARQFQNFSFHHGAPWERLETVESNGTLLARVHTPIGVFDFDHLIIGTGFVTDLTLRPELTNLVNDIALWSDKYTPPASEAHADLGRHPYLGPSFEYQEKVPGQAPHLNSVFNYTFGGLASLGFGGASISGMKYSLPKVIDGITRQLYLEDKDYYYQTLLDYNLEEFPLEVFQ